MAKRPVKKRKPRAKVPDTFGAEEAQIFDIPKPPDGLAYQWGLVDHLARFEATGWVRVPFDRHAEEMPKSTKVDGYIVYLDNTLLQRDQAAVRAKITEANQAAKKQLEDHPAYQKCWPHGGYVPMAPILSDHFVVSSAYERVQDSADPIILDVTIPVRMPARWQDTANALGLSHQQYLQRAISLYVRGETGGLLLPIDGAMELHQIYINDGMKK